MSSLPTGHKSPRPSTPKFFLSQSDRIGIKFPYDEKIVDRLKTIPDSRWERDKQCWSFPGTRQSLEKILAAFRTDWRILDKDFVRAFGLMQPEAGGRDQRSSPNTRVRSDVDLMTQELKIRNYSPKTIKSYGCCVRTFAEYFAPRPLRKLENEDIRKFLMYLIEVKKLSAASVGLALNALRFLYVEIFQRPLVLQDFQAPKRRQRLPVVLSPEEVKSIFESLGNLKHRTMMMLTYSAGLRVGEIVRLRLEDIDSHRKVIFVRSAKGNKDRYTILSDLVLATLREYWKAYKPKVWVFEGQREGKQYSIRTAERVFESAAQKAGIHKHVSIHTLRHSFATHMLEQGTDIRFIQELLGHSSVKTTEIYTHVSKRHIGVLKSPIDQLLRPQKT